MAKTESGPQKGESARLRAKIDSGELGDKVTLGDPATAPLGTDSEASGTPTPGPTVEREIRERERIAESFQKPTEEAHTAQRRWGLIGLGVLVALLTVALIALSLPG